MLTGKYTSIKRVLENVYRDYGFTTELNPSDAIEWAADAFDRIGAGITYMPKIACITINNHRGMLPCNVHTIRGVREKDSDAPLVYSTDPYLTGDACNEDAAESTCQTGNCKTIVVNDIPSTDIDNNTFCNPFFNSNPNPDTSQLTSQDIDVATLTYTVNDDYIFTGFESGCVEIAYLAFPVDDNNIPMIPDDHRIIDAIVKYIAYRILFKEGIRGKVSGDLVAKAEQDWLWAVGNARCHALMPSVDHMESIKNQWLRLIPKINEHALSFERLNVPEQIYVKSH